MFFRLSNGTLVNLTYVTEIVPITHEDGFSIHKIRDLYTLDELSKFGYKVGNPMTYKSCNTKEDAMKAVSELPSKRILCKDKIGYAEIDTSNKSLLTLYYDNDGNMLMDTSCMCFLPTDRYKNVFAYKLGLNFLYQHEHYIRLDEYDRIQRILDIR